MALCCTQGEALGGPDIIADVGPRALSASRVAFKSEKLCVAEWHVPLYLARPLLTSCHIESERRVMESEPLKQFMEDGFLIVPGVIPPDRLDDLRARFEVLVDRQKAISAKNRRPGDPPGGAWETRDLPRLSVNDGVAPETAETLELLLHENIMKVNRTLMRAPDFAPQRMFLMCNPVHDHGPGRWHFDINTAEQPPLGGLHQDLAANGPASVQWNIALYDDSVFWVVPGSHRRPTTEEENRCLLGSLRKPLPTGRPMDLKAGDGLVYTNAINHWGSNYSSKLRRTLLVGYRCFGGSALPLNPHYRWQDLDFARPLSPSARHQFERAHGLLEDELDRIASIYRAVIAKDEPAFREGLNALHPAAAEQIVCVALLEKLAKKIRFDPTGTRQIWQHERMTERLAPSEVETLWTRFEPLEQELQSWTIRYASGFHGDPGGLYPYDMPADYDVDDFVAGWKN